MSLRVTQGMVYSNALAQIRAAALRGFDVRSQLATGRRVLQPSDDPAALLQIMPLHGELRDLTQIAATLSEGKEILNNATSVLEQASATMQSLRELTVQAATGTTTQSDRLSLVSEVDQLLQQMLASGNASWNGRFLFAGTQTATTPFRIGSNGKVEYLGDQARVTLQISKGITTEMNLPGDQIFLARDRQPTVFQGSTGAQPSGAADSGIGFGTLDISFAGLAIPTATTGIVAGNNTTTALGNLSYSYAAGAPPTLSINGGPATAITGAVQSFAVGNGVETVSLQITAPIVPPTGTIVSQAALSTDAGATSTLVTDFSSTTNYQAVSSADGSITNVKVDQLVRIGQERVTYQGTFDPFTTLLAIRDTLRNDAGDPDSVIGARLNALLPEIDSAHDGILDGLQELGSRSQNLDLFETRLADLKLSRTTVLSDLEDVDIAEAVTKLSQYDLSFQASLQVSARALQTTLLNFLR